jgi:hypothetical protein
VNGMKTLLIDPLDSADAGEWAAQRWDQIIDLGTGGKNTYERWSRQLQCPVIAFDSLRNGFDAFRRTRDRLSLGRGRFFDEYGLDWWEITSMLFHGELEALILLQDFVATLGAEDEVHVSRPGVHADFLQYLSPQRAHVFPLRREAQRRGLAHYLQASKKLSLTQMIDIVWDKYDSGQQFRGRFARRRQPSPQPVVLLPTAYINVSRTGIAYANTFPNENFLLVTTRHSGWVRDRPKNVAAARLTSYVAHRDRSRENAAIGSQWRALLDELRKAREFEILRRLGYLDAMPQRFRQGFEMRDAWLNVLDTEPVQAVLCSDDSNPYTRIPLLLARERGLPSIACHHGALDGRYFFKRSFGSVIWAKGKMEQDYLVRTCSVPREKVEINAPALPANFTSPNPRESPPLKTATFLPNILFISEAYDVAGGRPQEFYRDLVPPLADLALATKRKLIVKLHPAESPRERSRMLGRMLSDEQRKVLRVVSGPLTEEVLQSAWFGITVLSTVSIECAIRRIPCFLCKWLEFWPYGYIDQYIRFGVGIGLNEPAEIAKIPEYLQNFPPRADAMANLWQPAAPERLRELLTAPHKTLTTAVR